VSLCVLAPAAMLALAGSSFSLVWTHSVEKTEWRERWAVVGDRLVLQEARVRGSGAGMDPPDGSVLRYGWWVYHADRAVGQLNLAVSGATGRGWQLCPGDGGPCHDLESELATAGQPPVRLRVQPGPCPGSAPGD
jgi:hypothetical protein